MPGRLIRRRSLALLPLLGGGCRAPARLPGAPPLVPAPDFAPAGPAGARGAAVWLHGSFDPRSEPPPPPPDWLAPLAGAGYDMWQFVRGQWRQDPLAEGGTRLRAGLAALRASGYRRVVVAGFSRGAFIGLDALTRPDLADAVAAVSPAAHGTRPERRAEALAEFAARMQAAGPVALALVLLAEDPFDPDPAARAALARASAPGRAGRLLLVDRPDSPRGHMGSFEPAFAARFAPCLGAFLDGRAGPGACPAG